MSSDPSPQSRRKSRLSRESNEKLESTLRQIFDQFDADRSGAVSSDELKTMLESLGMLVSPDLLKKMMNEADTDKSGEIDFDEFTAVMKKQAETGGAFADLVNRTSNNGPANHWRADPVGKGCEIGSGDPLDPRYAVRAPGCDGWGSITLDRFTEGVGFNAASYLFFLEDVGPETFVGLCDKNFAPDEQAIAACKKLAVLEASTGNVFVKGKDQRPSTRLQPFKAGDTFQIEVRMQSAEAVFSLLTKVKLPDGTDGGYAVKASANIPLQGFTGVTPVVCFGPTTDAAAPCKVLLKGQSCERSLHNGMDENKVMSNEEIAASNPSAGAAMSMA